MNNFCRLCTGDNRVEIRYCNDTNCPFYPFRWANITHEDDKEIAEKLLGGKDEKEN